MASAARILLDEALNKTDIDNSEVSAIINTLETQLSDPNLINDNQNSFKEQINSDNSGNTSVAISRDHLTSNGLNRSLLSQQQSSTEQGYEKKLNKLNNNNGNFINNNKSARLNSPYDSKQQQTIYSSQQKDLYQEGNQQQQHPSSVHHQYPQQAQQVVVASQQLTNLPIGSHQHIPQHQRQQHQESQFYQTHHQNMPKINEPIKLVYPQQQQQQQQHHQQHLQQHQTLTMNNNNNQQTGGNRVTFTSQSLPNGTVSITSQAQQIMHTVPNSTTIKTISAGGMGGQHHQQQHHQSGMQTTGATQTLVIKNQTVSLPAGLVSSAPGIVTMTKTIQGNQQNLVGSQGMIPASVQIVGMRPGNPMQNQQKTLGGLQNRVVIGGPHMSGARPQSPAITLSALQSLQAGQSGPALILKTENGQYQLLRVGPAPSGAVNQNLSNTGNQTIRLQTVPAQQPTVTSGASIVVNSVASTNVTQVLATQTNSSIQHHQQPNVVASVAPVPALAQQTHHHSQQQQHHLPQQQQVQQHIVVSQHAPQQQQSTLTITSGAAPMQHAVQKSVQQNTKEKCRKFLANLIELSTKESKPVERNVRTLIQELIDANVEPEEFCDRLERLLNASPQPCLIGFLKKSLPLLRQSLYAKEMVIEGIKPPPQHVVGIIGSTTLSTQLLPKIQAQIRPIGQQTTTIGQTQVRMVTQAAPRPIGQTTITKQMSGGVRIQGPIQTATGMPSGPRLMNAQIRPIGISQATTGSLVQNSNLQSPPALQPVSGGQTIFTPPNVVQIRAGATANRSPATVQIRANAPGTIRANAPGTKVAVKVGQTQIKQIQAAAAASSIVTAPVTPSNIAHTSMVPAPVNNVIASARSQLINSTPSPAVQPPNLTANKVLTIKAQSAQQLSSKSSAKQKTEKKLAAPTEDKTNAAFFQQSTSSMSTSIYGDDDINDVAAMGGVNLAEESQRILGSTEKIGTEIRSCKDEVFLHLASLQNRIRAMIAERGLEEPSQEVAVLISHACQERLKNIVEKLAVIAEHRIDIIKIDPRYEITKDVRGQIKFLEELDKAEQKRHEEREREVLLRAAKSRSKIEDPEQAKLKAKAKEMQRAEMEELRQRDANMTALQAIGPRKKPKLDDDTTTSTITPGTQGPGTSGISPAPLRPRIKRVNLRDMLFFMEQEKETCRSTMLHTAYLK